MAWKPNPGEAFWSVVNGDPMRRWYIRDAESEWPSGAIIAASTEEDRDAGTGAWDTCHEYCRTEGEVVSILLAARLSRAEEHIQQAVRYLRRLEEIHAAPSEGSAEGADAAKSAARGVETQGDTER